MRGDTLASGGKSATFGGPNVSQKKWDEIFGKDTGPKKKRRPRKAKPSIGQRLCESLGVK